MKRFTFEITLTEQDLEGDEFWENALERDGTGIADLTDALIYAIESNNLLAGSDTEAKDVIKLKKFEDK